MGRGKASARHQVYNTGYVNPAQRCHTVPNYVSRVLTHPRTLCEQEDLMRRRTPFKLTAVGVAAALLVSACGGDSGEAGDDGDAAGSGGTLRIYSSEPASLLPSNASDQPSILVIRQLYSGLVDYDTEGAPVLDLAESIESEDNQLWTIKLKEGYTFHNGEPVNADAFIRAWNYTADGDNAQENAYFMERSEEHTSELQ